MPDRLSALDASFLYLEESTTPMHVGSVMVFDPPADGFDYDRLVHLGFGLLLVHPVGALLSRHLAVRPKLAIAVAVCFVLAASALYEIFEWLLTLCLAGPAADQYNGQQGDIWDAQKDMACAGAGAIAAAIWLVVRTQVKSRARRPG